MIGSPGWAPESWTAPVDTPVRLVVGPGVGRRFGEVEEGLDLGERRRRRPVRGRPARAGGRRGSGGRVDDESGAGRGERAGGDQVRPADGAQLGELAADHGGVARTMARRRRDMGEGGCRGPR